MKNLFGVLISAAMMMAVAAPVQAADMDVQAKVKQSMSLLQEKLNKLGAPKLEGTSKVAGKTTPAIWFGSVKINGNYDVVDEVQKEMGGTATVFVKAGDAYVRVSTNMLQDGGARAVGTPLAHNPAYKAIKKGQAFYGQVDILGKPYDTGYEPIKDASGKTIGIYFVGYKKP
jgi:hypothetical protein